MWFCVNVLHCHYRPERLRAWRQQRGQNRALSDQTHGPLQCSVCALYTYNLFLVKSACYLFLFYEYWKFYKYCIWAHRYFMICQQREKLILILQAQLLLSQHEIKINYLMFLKHVSDLIVNDSSVHMI